MRRQVLTGLLFLLALCATGRAQTDGIVLNYGSANGPFGTVKTYKIATLAPDTASYEDHLHMIATFSDGGGSASKAQLDLEFGNRNGFDYFYSCRGAFSVSAHILAYRNSDSTTDIYLRLEDSWVTATYSILEEDQETVYTAPLGDSGSDTPPGTLVFDSADRTTYPPISTIDYAGDFTTHGNVGVGNPSPSGKLDVVTANDTAGGNLSAFDSRHFVVGAGPAAGAGAGGVFISYDQTNNRGYLGSVSPGVAWRSLSLQPISGNVGVGVIAPVAPFQVGSLTTVQTVVASQSVFGYNTYWDGSNWRYMSPTTTAAIRMYNNNINFMTTVAGSAGDVVSTMDTTGPKMVLFNSGGLTLGNSLAGSDPGAGNLKVEGAINSGSGYSINGVPVLTSSGGWSGAPLTSTSLPADVAYTDSTSQTFSGQTNFTSNVVIGSTSTGGHNVLTVNGNYTDDVQMSINNGSSAGFNSNPGQFQIAQMGTNGYGIHNWSNASVIEAGGTGGLVLDAYSTGGITFQTNRAPHMTLLNNGNLGLGTETPGYPLEVTGDIKLTTGQGGSIRFQDSSVQTTAWNGTTSGGDYAESVDVVGSRAEYEPGDVIVIDESQDGKFLKSSKPYATTISGIYSTKPGLLGRRQLPGQASALPNLEIEIPMAMVGIVPTKVTAENGPIRRGDLLVTSSTAGHAMKGTDRSMMAGAIVGRALGNLEAGTGVIEVLLALQ